MAAMSAMEPHHVNGSLGEWASGGTDTHSPVPARCSASLVRPLAASFSPSASVCWAGIEGAFASLGCCVTR